MTFTPVEKLPEKQKNTYKKNTDMLNEFMKMNVKYARVEYSKTDYCSESSVVGSLSKSIRTNMYPIRLKTINGELYLIRKDLEEVSV